MCYIFLRAISVNTRAFYCYTTAKCTLTQQKNTKASISLEQVVLLPIAFLVFEEMSTSKDCRYDF